MNTKRIHARELTMQHRIVIFEVAFTLLAMRRVEHSGTYSLELEITSGGVSTKLTVALWAWVEVVNEDI